MLLGRVRVGRRTLSGIVEGDTIHIVRGGLFGRLERTGESFTAREATLLTPTVPTKVVAIGLNYRTHLGDDRDAPGNPEPFLKAPSSVIGAGEPIVLPADAGRVDEEGEVVAVIGRRARNLTENQVDDYVLGYTGGNDVSARHWQRDDLQWWRAKSADSFTAVGPFIATDLDPERIGLRVSVNDEVVQEATTADLIHSVRACIAWISRSMTLERGDLVFTGTPGETRQLHPGDSVRVDVEGVGFLVNPVVAESA